MARCSSQHVTDGVYMARLARVAGAQHGYLLYGEPCVIHSVCQHEGQGLERLGGGPCEGQEVRVASGGKQAPLRVYDGNRSHVLAFHMVRGGRAAAASSFN